MSLKLSLLSLTVGILRKDVRGLKFGEEKLRPSFLFDRDDELRMIACEIGGGGLGGDEAALGEKDDESLCDRWSPRIESAPYDLGSVAGEGERLNPIQIDQ